MMKISATVIMETPQFFWQEQNSLNSYLHIARFGLDDLLAGVEQGLNAGVGSSDRTIDPLPSPVAANSFERFLFSNQQELTPHLDAPVNNTAHDEVGRDLLTGWVADLSQTVRRTQQAGLVNNQANSVVRADFSRPLFGVDGAGITIGVVSDSFNVLGGAAANVASGDLPPNVTVLREGDRFDPFNEDEGRAMLQLIYDVAPGARLLFHTAGNSDREMGNAIRALADAGANIIVDDIRFLQAPYFQDGWSAQAVNEVVARGVAYFSAAGNDGRDGYESPFRNSGITFSDGQLPLSSFAQLPVEEFYGGTAHDFDPGPGIDVYQSFTLGPNEKVQVIFQWDQPFASVNPGIGATNELDIYVLDATQRRVVGGSTNLNIGDDPVESFEFTNLTGATSQFNFLILRSEGADPGLMRYLLLDDIPTINEFATNSPTIYGPANALGAIAVGAADYRTPTILQDFSSAGPTPILFSPTGNRLPVPEFRLKPNLVAPDNTNTTFFGEDTDGDGRPNFVGTSAAAPSAAAVAALVLQVAPTTSPADLYAVLQSTATDIGTPGFDFGSGFGLIQADRAVGLLRLFNPNFYLAQNPDVGAAVSRGFFRSPLDHFLQAGQFEGRDPGPLFNNRLYLAQNPDVAAAVAGGAFRSGFQHFLDYGQVEGRDRRTFFDANFYLAQNSDVAAVVTAGAFRRSGFVHFIESGQRERRNPNAFFDTNFYLSQNPDVAAAIGQGVFLSGYDHFLKAGQFESRSPSSSFNTSIYLTRYPDIAAAIANGVFRSAFEHFFLFGRNEGRVPA